MSREREIKRAIQAIVGEHDLNAQICQVHEVQEKTCTVIRLLDGDKLYNVRLTAGKTPEGILLKPAKESYVLVSEISEIDRYVSMFSIVDSFTLQIEGMKIFVDKNGIEFNDSAQNSYLTNINKLVAEINAIRRDINTLKRVFQNWTPVPSDGGAVLQLASAAWALQLLQPDVTVEDLKDDKIKH